MATGMTSNPSNSTHPIADKHVVLRDHMCIANGVAFHDRLYYNFQSDRVILSFLRDSHPEIDSD